MGLIVFMSKKLTVMIDGGHLRSYLKKARKPLTADYIELVGLRCGIQSSEEIIRILYYGCAPFTGTTKRPVSRQDDVHNTTAPWLHDLALKDLFAVRRGVLKFRGYVVKKTISLPILPSILTLSPSSNRRASICGSVSIWRRSLLTAPSN